MKTLFLSAAFVALTSAAAFAQGSQGADMKALATGAAIPPMTMGMPLQATDGRMVTLQEAKTGKGLLVMFSCNTCPFVVKSQNRTKEVMAMAKKNGIGMVIVNSNQAQRSSEDSPEAMAAYAKKQGYTVPYVQDENSQMADAFGASHTPEVFLFDGKGMLAYHGAMEDNPSEPSKSKQMYLASAVSSMLAGKPAKPADTKSIGCGIKRMH